MLENNNIDQQVMSRLTKSIRELLNAGWTTGAIRDALSKQRSFGKYDGCTPNNILAIANDVCREVNVEIRKQNREIAKIATASLRESFPDIAKYFKC